jgi:hypothetical protein
MQGVEPFRATCLTEQRHLSPSHVDEQCGNGYK